LKVKLTPSKAQKPPEAVKHAGKSGKKGHHVKKKSAGYALQLGEATEEDSDSANDFEESSPTLSVPNHPPPATAVSANPVPLTVTPEIEKVNAALFGMLDWLPNSNNQGLPVAPQPQSHLPPPHGHHQLMQSMPAGSLHTPDNNLTMSGATSPTSVMQDTAPLPYTLQFQEKITPISPPKPKTKGKMQLSKSSAAVANTSSSSVEPVVSPHNKTPRSKTPRSKTPRSAIVGHSAVGEVGDSETTEKVSEEDLPKKEKKVKKVKEKLKKEKKVKAKKSKNKDGLLFESDDPASPRKKEKKKEKKKSKHKEEGEKKHKKKKEG